jgi:WD40 repeat protein
VATGKEKNQFAAVRGRGLRTFSVGQCIALNRDGKTLAAGVDDGTVRLWQTATGKEVQQLRGFQNGAYSVLFSADGKTLATGEFHTVRLWDVATGKEGRQLEGFDRPPFALAFSHDAKILVAASDNGQCRVWQLPTGKEDRHFKVIGSMKIANPIGRKWKTVGTAGSPLPPTAKLSSRWPPITTTGNTPNEWFSGRRPPGRSAAGSRCRPGLNFALFLQTEGLRPSWIPHTPSMFGKWPKEKNAGS